MSAQLKKKTKRKKKKKEEDETGPQKHERIGNLNYYSEEISKDIIEKIISLVLSSHFNGKVEKKSANFCYDSLKKAFDNIIEIIYLNHDNDDFDLDNIEIHNYIKTNKSDKDLKRFLLKKHKYALDSRNDNTEKDIMQMAHISKDYKTYMNLKNKKIEDCLNKSTNIKKNKYLKKIKIFQYSIDIEKKNFWDDIPCPNKCNIDRTSSNFNTYFPKNKERHNKNIITSRIKEENVDNNKIDTIDNNEPNIKPSLSYKKFILRLSKNFSKLKGIKGSNYEEIFTNKKRVQMIDMPSFPIENFEPRKEANDIINLRKEKIDMIIQKEREIKRQEMLKLRKKKEEAEQKKMKNKGKFTYDNEGNLILVNEIKQENLFKEFWPVTTKQKEIKRGKDLDSYKKEKIKMENIAKKNIIYNDEDNHYNSYLIKSRFTEPLINLKDLKQKNNIKDNNNQVRQRRRFEGFFFDPFPKQKIEPSGSNFQLINPSCGVVIKERAFQKSGGNDYFKEFKKYSIDEYNKTLQDSIEWTRYKQIEQNDKINEGFKTTITNGLNNIKKSFLFKTNEKNNNESNSLLNINGNYNSNYINRLKRNIKIQNKQDNFGKTFSEGFNNNQQKNTLLKSSSEIVLGNEKFINLKELLFHDDKEKYIKIMPYSNKHKNNITLFKHNRIQSSQGMDEKISSNKKRFYEIDNLNKNLITGKIDSQSIIFQKMVLPKISLKNNETNFNRTMINFFRERNKKPMFDNFEQKKYGIIRLKKVRKIKSVKNNSE